MIFDSAQGETKTFVISKILSEMQKYQRTNMSQIQ